MNKSTGSDVNQMYKSRKNLLKFITERGFTVDDYEEFNINDIHAMLQHKQLDMLFEDDDKKVYVKYHLGKTLRPANINEYVEDLYDIENVLNDNSELIVVAYEEPNDTLIAQLDMLWNTEKRFITIFSIKRLQYNMLDNNLVPKHEIVSDDDAVIIRQKYNIVNNFQIPEIARFDPAARCIGLRPGKMCKITRPSRTSIDSVFYRLCI